MGKSLYIAEKPSVAAEFAKALKINTKRMDGYMESEEAVVTWCVGHLVKLSYPEVYDESLKKWTLDTLPFLPKEFKYEVIANVKKQFNIVKGLLTRNDVDTIYICTDSGREGEYIYRLVDQMAGVKEKIRKRVWIDSQTEEEILRGIKEAKDWSEYDNLASAAYLRAKEDYLMGINFSRVLTLKYGNSIARFLNQKYAVVSVGRVMTCVLGMIVRREREIRDFVKTPFYRVLATGNLGENNIELEWKAEKGSKYFESPLLYKENGFKNIEDANNLKRGLTEIPPVELNVLEVSKKTEKKNPPLLYNLAEIQNDCSKVFKISPNDTLKIIQELYERKLVTYPRTDARVLSTAVAKEINKNLNGLKNYSNLGVFAQNILENGLYKNIAKTKYVNDKQITDHYAIIPTGQGNPNSLTPGSLHAGVYNLIAKRFLSIFYPAAVYKKINIKATMPYYENGMKVSDEFFSTSVKLLESKGFMEITGVYGENKKDDSKSTESVQNVQNEEILYQILNNLRKNDKIAVSAVNIKEGETTPPKRYNSGSLILAMENAGQLIEDEELREQIKGSGIGTSATRAEIIDKLIKNKYISLNKKTQIITPQLLGEMIYDVVNVSIKSLLNPELTASWEKGLTLVSEGQITQQEYMDKLEGFVSRRTNAVRQINNHSQMIYFYNKAAANYKRRN